MIWLDQGQLVIKPPDQGGLAAVREVVRHELAKVLQPLNDMKRRLDEHTSRHTAIKINLRWF